MSTQGTLPSLLVFGPQTELPSTETLEKLRLGLQGTHSIMRALRGAINELPCFWKKIVDGDPDLAQVPGTQYLEDLSRWVEQGGSFPHHDQKLPYHFALPVTVLLHIGQYVNYLEHLGSPHQHLKHDVHHQVLGSVMRSKGGVQGFCIGFLSALAVAVPRREVGIGPAAAVSLRLAVCIGAYVDRDSGPFSRTPERRTACVAIRWKTSASEGFTELDNTIAPFPEAYISSVNDANCVTVTLELKDADRLMSTLVERGMQAKVIPVHGRFHTPAHASAVEKLVHMAEGSESFFTSSSLGLQFPGTGMLQAPVRTAVDGGLLSFSSSASSLTRLALENTLLSTANWWATFKASTSQFPVGHRNVVGFAGFGNHVPVSIRQYLPLDVIYLQDLWSSGPTRKLPPDAVDGNVSIFMDRDSLVPPAYPSHSIAIVGMAGRFPDADSVDELWDLILDGKSTVRSAPVEKLGLSQDGDFANTDWWGNFLRDSETFDNHFFQKSSREALAWDPQQRILLEVIYEALESAGYFGPGASSTDSSRSPSAKREPQDYGCYVGAATNPYYDNVSCHAATAYAIPGTSRCFISGSMSHYFGWTGPSLTIDTGCSACFVAVNMACRAILSGECSRAVVGGTNVFSSPFDYQNLQAGGFLSPSGQCKPFDAAADGYCRAEAVTAVVLKRLSDAVAENDNILGAIVGSAANQNHNSSHIAVPHSGSQVDLFQKVMRMGDLEPKHVSYVECHGTGTSVGDPVEARSVREAFGGPQRGDSLLHFGSLKGNIGHAEASAGIAGLIKVILMMRHGKLTAQASLTTLNPNIPALEPDRMVISRSVRPWEAPFRVACVNSYGAAGSNSAVLLREPPPPTATTSLTSPETASALPDYAIFFSAGSQNSLYMYGRKLLEFLETSVLNLGCLAFNLADRGNHALPFLFSTTVNSTKNLKTKLEEAVMGQGVLTKTDPKPVVLVFGGQESNFIGLSEQLYLTTKVFRRHIDECNDILVSRGLDSLYPAIFQFEQPVRNLVTLHTGLFAVQYASSRAWMDCGLQVDAVVGHSFGQLTALCITGVLSLPDALKLVAGRASLISQHWGSEQGSMLFVQADRLTVERLQASLEVGDQDEGYWEIACYNGPRSHVVVGSSAAITRLERHIATFVQHPIRTKRLQVTNGFHSKYTEPLLLYLDELALDLKWCQPRIHIELCEEMERGTRLDSTLIKEHTRRPVFFQQAVERLSARFGDDVTWLEAGRGSSVVQMVKHCVQSEPIGEGRHEFISPRLIGTGSGAQTSLANATVKLWQGGHDTQYWGFHRSQRTEYGYLSLPPHQFEKTRHWLPFTGRKAGTGKEPDTRVVSDAEETISSVDGGAFVPGKFPRDDGGTNEHASPSSPVKLASKRQQLLQVLSNVTEIPTKQLTDESMLLDHGIDSLMATEVLHNIRAVIGLTIDLPTFLVEFPNIGSLVAYVEKKTGESTDPAVAHKEVLEESGKPRFAVKCLASPSDPVTNSASCPTLVSVHDTFEETRLSYDRLAQDTRALGFWAQAYPHQERLVLAYVVEVFSQTGCDLRTMRTDEVVSQLQCLGRHMRLVYQLCRILQDGKLIAASPTTAHKFVRTDVSLDQTPAETIYQEMIGLFPQHASLNKLVRVVGSQMVSCLQGRKDALQVLFGDHKAKETLEEVYEFWPLFRTPALLLGEFLVKAFSKATGGGKFRILEVGAGTGGTTRHIIDQLNRHGISFEYCFTDVSASLVAMAKKKFKDSSDELQFEVLDIEKPPKPAHLGAFHVVIATNCIHATRDLSISLRHLRQMLREDGALTLIEIMKHMSWLDIVFGLLEGWWRFDDGRSHALVDEKHWESVLKGASFGDVAWSDGQSPESKTVRVIGAFPRSR